MRHPEAGELKSRIELYRWIETPAEDGGLNRDLTEICKTWCKVEVVSAQMFWGTAQIDEAVTHRFWLRAVPGRSDVLTLTGQVKAVYKGNVFRVKRVTDYQEAGVWTILEAECMGTNDNGD